MEIKHDLFDENKISTSLIEIDSFLNGKALN